MGFQFIKLSSSNPITCFAFVDPNNDKYLTYNGYRTWKALNAKVYRIQNIESELQTRANSQSLSILLLPYYNWNSAHDTISTLENVRENGHYSYFMDLDDSLEYLYDLDIIHTKPNIVTNNNVIPQNNKPSQSVTTNKPKITQHNYHWANHFVELNEPLFYSKMENIPTIKDFIYNAFGSEFYNIPISSEILYDDDQIRASNITLDVSLMKNKTIVDCYYNLERQFKNIFEDLYDEDSLLDLLAKRARVLHP